MAIHQVLKFPDKRLRKIALPVKVVDAVIQQLVDDMFETMYVADGIGLAATQIDVHQRVVVMDVPHDDNIQDSPRCFINPEITAQSGTQISEEGCLSVPDFFDKVERAATIMVSALDEQGKSFTLEATGRLAVCIQHEIDHLNGKLFVDYLSPFKRQLFMRKVKKLQKQQNSGERELSA